MMDDPLYLEDLENDPMYTPVIDDSIEDTLTHRGGNYGAFSGVSELSQALKSVMHSRVGFQDMTRAQKEALEMIQHKIARIINGDPSYSDSWHDIAGYATLVAKINNGENP